MFRALLEFNEKDAHSTGSHIAIPYNTTVMNYAPGFEMNNGAVSFEGTHLTFAPLTRFGSPGYEQLCHWNVKAPYHAMEALDEAVNRVSKYLGQRIDLTPAGCSKIREAWEQCRLADIASDDPGLSDKLSKVFLDKILSDNLQP